MKIVITTDTCITSETDSKILKEIVNLLAKYKADSVYVDYEGRVWYWDEQ